MKKKLLIIISIFLFFFIDATISYAKRNNYPKEIIDKEIRAVYISYLEYLKYFNGGSKTVNQAKIIKMIDNIKSNNLNCIILHVSPFSDSIYKSKIFPYSYTLTGVEGKNPGFDYLSYFIKESHAKDIKIYAWINPYRISFDNDTKYISKDNPAYRLLNTSSILIDKNGIYYNPASEIVKNLIVKQVEELIQNYSIDGIHFDDYFYIQNDIDKIEYKSYIENGGILNLSDFRLKQTNDLIERVYKTIKKKNKEIIFSIAPDGNINNNYEYHYADIKTWLKESNYIDMIMPQIYYGFENEYSPFKKVLDNWLKLRENKNIQVVPVLASYKVGEIDKEAGTGKNEWIDNKNIIKEQISLIKTYNLNGYAFFRYDFLVSN